MQISSCMPELVYQNINTKDKIALTKHIAKSFIVARSASHTT